MTPMASSLAAASLRSYLCVFFMVFLLMNQKMSCFAEHGRCPAGPGRTVPAPAIHIHEEGHAETRTALCAARKHAFLPPDVLHKLPQSGNVSPGFLLIGDAASSWLTACCQEIIGGWFPGKKGGGNPSESGLHASRNRGRFPDRSSYRHTERKPPARKLPP